MLRTGPASLRVLLPRSQAYLTLTNLQIHHEAKHPKEPWEPEKCINQHASGPVTRGVAVQGSKKK